MSKCLLMFQGPVYKQSPTRIRSRLLTIAEDCFGAQRRGTSQ